MLKSWLVHNFKAIGDAGELQLAPITVLAGLNSSGKTSLLQSILMIAQTLGSRLVDRPLLPNERIIQLGTFEDVLASFSHTGALHIGFEVALVDEEEEEVYYYDDDDPITAVRREQYTAKMHVTFRSLHQGGAEASAIEASKVFVESATLDITDDNTSVPQRKELTRHTFSYHAITEEELALFLQYVKPQERRQVPSSGEQRSYLGSFALTEQDPSPSPYLLTLSHFLPLRLIRKFQEREHIQHEIELDLTRMLVFNRAPGARFRQILPTTLLSEQLQAVIHQFCQRNGILPPFEGTSLLDLEVWAHVIRTKENETSDRVLSYVIKLVTQYLLDQRVDEHVELLTPVSLDSHDEQIAYLMRAVNGITTFFSRNIRYLGPLRADPGTIQQQFAPTGNIDEVGAKGEYAATVYHYNQQARLEYYHPIRGEIEQATLQEALDTWAHYLGVAYQVRTDMAGVSGMTWKVFLKPDIPPRALSQVGVGTSQILPLLVMGLLSPTQSLLVIEQPELHLHPRIQSRLGDFFLGLAKCHKQCVIETHSENLINQLRHHIVRSGGQGNSGCAIYFAQQDEQGTTTFESVRISARGNIMNWPDGFFDETLLQQEHITEEYLRQEIERSDDEQHPG